jgi:hypothetical protein
MGENPELRFDEPEEERQVDIPEIITPGTPPSEQTGQAAPELPENIGIPDADIPKIDPYVEWQRIAEVARTEAVGFDGPRKWKGDHWGRYDVDDWLRGWSEMSQMVGDSTVQQAMIESTYKPNGLPSDWDYRNPVDNRGPWGELLPEGAIGWNPHGEPDWGPGPINWFRKQWAKVTEIRSYEEIVEDVPDQYIDENYAKTRDKLWEDGDKWEWLKFTGGKKINALSQFVQKNATENPTPWIAYTAGFAQNIVLEGALEVFNVATVAIERLLGPAILSASDIVDSEAAKGTIAWYEVIDKIPVVREASRIVLGYTLAAMMGRMDELNVAHREYSGIEEGGWESAWGLMGSRISYSLATDQMLREDYKRRIAEGEDPRLLAMDLELPGVELGTRLALDPLNALGPMGQAAKARKLLARGHLIHATPIDEMVKLTDEMIDISKATSAKGISTRIAATTDGVRTAMANVRAGVLDLGTKRGMRILTANGKRATVGRRIGDHLNTMYSHFAGDTEGFFNYVNGMVLVGSDDAVDIQKGLTLLTKESNAPLNMAFSQAGTEMGVFMREVLYDASAGKLRSLDDLLAGLDEAADVTEFMGIVGKNLDGALSRIFPSLDEQIKLNDELAKVIKQFGKGSDEAAEFVAKNPQAENIISDSHRLMHRADLNMQKYFYGPVAKAQSFVYMRMNPVYAMRNRWTNAFHVMVDEGPKAAYKSFFSPDAALKEIDDLLGFIPSSATRGIGPKGGVRGLEKSFESGDFWNWSKKSQKYEQAASAQVYAKSIRESMRKGMKEGVVIPSRSFLTGWSDKEHDLLISLAKKHNGSKVKVMAELRKLGGDEGVNAARNLLFMEDDLVKTLKDLRLYDEVMEIGLRTGGLDEADELLDAIKAGYADEASRAASEAAVLGEPTNPTEVAEVADNLALEAGLAEAVGQDAADEAADLMARQILADRAMLREQDVILVDMEQDLLLTSRTQLDVDVASGTITRAQADEQAKDITNAFFGPTRSDTTRITDETIQQADYLRNSKLTADKKSYGIGKTPKGPKRDARFEAIWGETGLPSKPSSYFTDMTPKKFRRLGWEEYFPERNKLWVTRRNQVFLKNEELMTQTGALLGRKPEEMAELFGRTYRKSALAKMFDQAELLDDGTAVVRMTGSELHTALLDAHKDVVFAAQASKTDEAVGALEIQTAQFRDQLTSLTKRPDMSIDAAYGYLDEPGKQALAAIAGTGTGDAADIARQKEALSIIIGKEPYTITKMGTDKYAVSIIEGPNIMEFRVARDTDTGLPIIEQIGAVTPGQGTGEDVLSFYLRDQVAKGETEFLTTYQLEDVLGVKKGSGIVPDLTQEHLDDPISVLIQDVMEGKTEFGVYEVGAAEIGTRPGKGAAIHEGDKARKGFTSNRQWVVDARLKYSDEEIIWVLERIRAREDIPKYVGGTGKGVARKIVEEGTEGATNRSRSLKKLHDELLEEVRLMAVEGRPALTREVKTGGRTYQRTVAEKFDATYTTPGGEGFFKRMEEKGYITYLEDVPQPDKVMPDGSTLKIEDIKKYKINAENIKPKAAPDVFTQRLTAPDAEGFLNTPARNAYETRSAAYKAIEDVRTGLHANWGDLRQSTITPEMERSSQAWLTEMGNRATEHKAVSVEVANQTRDFILLDYEARTGLDNMLSYVYPYHFWYKGTYRNWMSRIRYNPVLASRYGHYRNWLESKHAGMPDWWKYNINIQEDLLGIETDSPLWFNLEATLNPMNGMTGVDFNDPDRRRDWWAMTADDLGKFGPTIWTPYSLAIATRYHLQGQDDAASKWTGRVSPLTRTFRDATALMGLNEGKGIEVDPFLHLYSGGIDPYEQARIGKQFSAMTDEGKYPEAALIDAAYTQKGPIWDEAHTRAIHQRAPNVLGILAPFFLGAGFKPRTESDIEIDRMYADMYGHMGSKSEQSPEAYQEGWDKLRSRYPFMDAVLMSRKGGLARDEAFAWNVLDRIPPGMTDEIADLVDIKGHDITKFYDSKGDLGAMDEPDRMRFMAAVLDIGALLDMPPAPTKAEWNLASNTYKELLAAGEDLFGKDIWDKVDVMYGKPSEDRPDYIKNNPIVEQALDWKQASVINSPIMAPYYTSIDRIEGYMKGIMYDVIEDELGERIWDMWAVYHELKDMNSADARRYYKANPELKRFGEIKDEMEPRIGTALIGIAGMLPDAKPPNWRGAAPEGGFDTTNTESEAWIRSEVLKYSSGYEPSALPEPAMNLDFLRQLIQAKGGIPLSNLLTDYLMLGEVMPLAAQNMLDDIGGDLGIDGEDILALMSEHSQ